MRILKETADAINEMLDNTKMLADKGYKGGNEDVPGLVVVNDSVSHLELRRRRVRIERFFGRMKNRFSVISNKFPLSEDWFNYVFDVCASIINVELTYHPLKEGDEDNERNFIQNLEIEEAKRRMKVKEKNDKYRAKKRQVLNNN